MRNVKKKKWFKGLIAMAMAVLVVGGILSADAGKIHVQDALVRTTQYGQVEGWSEDGVMMWKGVPYGKAPVGELRWKAPQPPETWRGVKETKTSGPTGVQGSGEKFTGSEDCLNLDIYRPKTDETDLPVLVFLHGGNNQTGQADGFKGMTMAREANCIFVSLNFRLGILGFNSLPALRTGNSLEDSGNFTMLDINYALEWVQENIGNFGGDKNNVTLAGFSSGGRNTMAALISPLMKGKFHKAISLSGGMTLADPEKSSQVAAKALAPLAVADGIKDTEEEAYSWLLSTDSSVREYLAQIPASRLAPLMANAGIRMAVFPHLFKDGAVISREGFETSEYNDVPVMMVTGTEEFAPFVYAAPTYFSGEEFQAKTEETQKKELDFGARYGNTLYQYSNAQASAEQLKQVGYRSPLYLCEVNFGSGKGSLFQGGGAFHGVEIPFIDESNTGFKARLDGAYDSEAGQQLGKTFRQYLRSFLHDGTPKAENAPTWDAWNERERLALCLDEADRGARIWMKQTNLDYDSVIRQMEEDGSITEEAKLKIIRQTLNGRWFSDRLDRHFGSPDLWMDNKERG